MNITANKLRPMSDLADIDVVDYFNGAQTMSATLDGVRMHCVAVDYGTTYDRWVAAPYAPGEEATIRERGIPADTLAQRDGVVGLCIGCHMDGFTVTPWGNK